MGIIYIECRTFLATFLFSVSQFSVHLKFFSNYVIYICILSATFIHPQICALGMSSLYILQLKLLKALICPLKNAFIIKNVMYRPCSSSKVHIKNSSFTRRWLLVFLSKECVNVRPLLCHWIFQSSTLKTPLI